MDRKQPLDWAFLIDSKLLPQNTECEDVILNLSPSDKAASRQPFSATDQALDSMVKEFEEKKEPLKINFRKEVNWIKVGDRVTHFIHSYPAKLLPHIANFFLRSAKLSKPGDIVLDPFGGSGTVALEAILANRNALIIDSNPLARMISKVKTTVLDLEALEKRIEVLRNNISVVKDLSLPNVVNLEMWFYPHTIEQLNRIRSAVLEEPNDEIREFFLITFSSIIRKVSLADPRLSVPVRLNPAVGNRHFAEKNKVLLAELKDRNAVEMFFDALAANVKRVADLASLKPSNSFAQVIGHDAKDMRFNEVSEQDIAEKLPCESVQLIITSPPYGGAQKYIRSSSLSLGWLGLTEKVSLRELEEKSIGREHHLKKNYQDFCETGIAAADEVLSKIFKIYPLRAQISAAYLNEMRQACAEMVRVLKPGGHLVLVIGNNVVCHTPFLTSEYLTEILQEMGMKVKLKLIDDIKSRGLMTKRNKTASVITREWVILFCKEQ